MIRFSWISTEKKRNINNITTCISNKIHTVKHTHAHNTIYYQENRGVVFVSISRNGIWTITGKNHYLRTLGSVSPTMRRLLKYDRFRVKAKFICTDSMRYSAGVNRKVNRFGKTICGRMVTHTNCVVSHVHV
jgi:hypothetical protein